MKIPGIPESISDNALENKIQGVLRGIDVEVDTENIEPFHGQKRKRINGKVILKHSKRKDADKIKSKKPQKTLKSLYHINLGCYLARRNFFKKSCCKFLF